MTSRPRIALAAALVTATFMIWAFGRAYDYELALAKPPTVHAGDGTLIHAINIQRARTWRCQNQLGRPRSRVSYAAERSPSVAFRKWTHRLWRKRADFTCHIARQLGDPVRAIYAVFGAYGAQAVAVARCESHLHVGARNGQYLGMFQMGAYARATYGHGWTPLEQARAAYRYFRAAGGWGPWACKP